MPSSFARALETFPTEITAMHVPDAATNRTRTAKQTVVFIGSFDVGGGTMFRDIGRVGRSFFTCASRRNGPALGAALGRGAEVVAAGGTKSGGRKRRHPLSPPVADDPRKPPTLSRRYAAAITPVPPQSPVQFG